MVTLHFLTLSPSFIPSSPLWSPSPSLPSPFLVPSLPPASPSLLLHNSSPFGSLVFSSSFFTPFQFLKSKFFFQFFSSTLTLSHSLLSFFFLPSL